MTFAVAFTSSSPSLAFSLHSQSPSQSLSLRRRYSTSLSFAPLPSLASSRLSLQLLPRASSSDLGRRIEFEPEDPAQDTAGGDGGDAFGGGGEGSGNGGGDDEEGFEEEGGGEEKKKKMLMSQKFTLAYAALVGVGGVIGFFKKGSMKSAAAGGLSTLLLYYVYTQLPTNPTFASSLGLGISGALLAVMGSRLLQRGRSSLEVGIGPFKIAAAKDSYSGETFPAGIVSLVSLFMTGGYLHAILRAGH